MEDDLRATVALPTTSDLVVRAVSVEDHTFISLEDHYPTFKEPVVDS